MGSSARHCPPPDPPLQSSSPTVSRWQGITSHPSFLCPRSSHSPLSLSCLAWKGGSETGSGCGLWGKLRGLRAARKPRSLIPHLPKPPQEEPGSRALLEKGGERVGGVGKCWHWHWHCGHLSRPAASVGLVLGLSFLTEQVLNSSMTSCPHIHAGSHGPLPFACSLCVFSDPPTEMAYHF